MVDRFALPAALMGSKFLVPRSIAENCTITDSSNCKMDGHPFLTRVDVSECDCTALLFLNPT